MKTTYADLIRACGLSPKTAAWLLGIKHSDSKNRSRGLCNPKPEEIEKLERYAKSADKIFEIKLRENKL